MPSRDWSQLWREEHARQIWRSIVRHFDVSSKIGLLLALSSLRYVPSPYFAWGCKCGWRKGAYVEDQGRSFSLMRSSTHLSCMSEAVHRYLDTLNENGCIGTFIGMQTWTMFWKHFIKFSAHVETTVIIIKLNTVFLSEVVHQALPLPLSISEDLPRLRTHWIVVFG